MDHALSWPWGGLVLAWHNNAAKEWDALGYLSLTQIAISYKPIIKIKTIHWGKDWGWSVDGWRYS